MNSADLTSAHWRKSSYSSGNGGDCVEVAFLADGCVAIRDSKDKGHGPALVFTLAEWAAFSRGMSDEEFGSTI